MQLEATLELASRAFTPLLQLDRLRTFKDRRKGIDEAGLLDVHYCYEVSVRWVRMEEDKSSGPLSALKLLPTTVTREELIQRQTQEIMDMVMERRRRKNELRPKGPGNRPGSDPLM